MLLQTTPLQTQQTHYNWPWLHLFVVTSNHAPATQSMIHSKMQHAPNTVTTPQHPLLSVNHIPDITTHPSTSCPKTFDSTHYSTLWPINWSSIHPTEVYQSDTTLCSTKQTTSPTTTHQSPLIAPPHQMMIPLTLHVFPGTRNVRSPQPRTRKHPKAHPTPSSPKILTLSQP